MQSVYLHIYIRVFLYACVYVHACPVGTIARLPVTGIFVFDFAKELAGLFILWQNFRRGSFQDVLTVFSVWGFGFEFWG